MDEGKLLDTIKLQRKKIKQLQNLETKTFDKIFSLEYQLKELKEQDERIVEYITNSNIKEIVCRMRKFEMQNEIKKLKKELLSLQKVQNKEVRDIKVKKKARDNFRFRLE
jgi:hypothetical protein